MQTPWEHRYAQRTQRMQSSAIREILKFTQLPGVISFAGGLPAPEVFPAEAVRLATERVLSTAADKALQYGLTQGYTPLRELIAERSARFGLNIDVENILITSGSQQALDFLGKIFINRGDHIVVESPSYLGALQAWNAYGVEYISIPIDEHGMKTDSLEAALRTGPKFIYVLPNFQNPTGVTLSLERREKLVHLADQYGVPVVEDDPYGQLRYTGDHLPPVVVLDSQFRNNNNASYHGNIIYLSTFSKILAPGFRLAWVVAPKEVIEKMVQAKQGADLHTSTFIQLVAHQTAQDDFLDQHVNIIRKIYNERRMIMLKSMDENFPKGVHWTRPDGGMF
ncbi:MAG: PLP-dependent aminotransferase family protein, partial [Chloroflexi bacterium]|nr:PLP-dependent aminotransferase family protein [Chloroflexota bacterium]